MKSYNFYLFIIFLLFVSPVISQETSNFNYSNFITYFDELNTNQTERLIPNNEYTRFLYLADNDEKIYGNIKIKFPGGYDFFILRQVIKYNDPEYQDIDNKFYLVFNDGKLVGDYKFDDVSRILENSTNSDGGELIQLYKIDKDTSFIVDIYHSDCCSSSGFNTPIDTRTKIRFKLNTEGKLMATEVLELIFSSSLFDPLFLEKNKLNNNFNYPTSNNSYKLFIDNEIQKIPLFGNDILIKFHINNSNNRLSPVFVTYDKNNLPLDTLILTQPKKKKREKEKIVDMGIINCPVIIDTSNKLYVVDPSGYFSEYKK